MKDPLPPRRRASISTVLVRPLALALEPVPGALQAFLEATDLTREMIADADARISPSQFCVAWAEAVRLSGDPALALTVAGATPPGAFGVVEYVCRCAPTLGAALTEWCRYLAILDDAVDVGLVEEAGHACLRVLRESEAPAPASHELCFALVAQRARALVDGALPLVEVRFAHKESSGAPSRHRAWFQCPVRFGAQRTEMVFNRGALAAALTSHDPNLLSILLPAAEARRARPTPEGLVTDQVERALRGALRNEDAQLDVIARGLGMTGRSLQRRLKDEGTSFQAVRDQTRQALADRYLQSGMSFAEISFLLGFSEPSAFFRAFKRWTGLTPVERRARLTREAAPA